MDNQFYNNVKGAQAAGIPIGAYHYGYAVTEEEARNEAGFFLDTVKGIRFEYPLYYDVEDSATMGSLDRDALTKVIRAFCETVEKAGYYVGIYASLNWLTNKFYPDQLPYDVWVAQYYSEDQYDGHHGMWQYTSGGTVGGIAGKVDMNIAYRDFPKLIKDKGLNGWGSGESGGSGGSEEGSGGERDDRLGIGHCVADVLNVRSGPGTDYPVVYQISTGNMVDVLKISENGWLQINCLHGVGWCAAQYIQWSPFESQQPPIGIGRCTADVLNVRTGSGLDYPAAFQLSQGNMSMCSQPAVSGFRSTAFWAPLVRFPVYRLVPHQFAGARHRRGKMYGGCAQYPFGSGHGSFRTVHYFRRQYGGCAGG